jgi:hypothetical protein
MLSMMFASHRLHVAVTMMLMVLFWVIITVTQLYPKLDDPGYARAGGTAFIIIWVLPLILLSVAPAKAVTRRLIFLAIGLILLIALNELSKLGLDVSAPKLQG